MPARRTLESPELRGLARSVAEADGLLLFLALLFLLAGGERIARPGAYLAVLAAYGLLILVFRLLRPRVLSARQRVGLECSAMVVFITAALACAGGEPGPLVNLYLVPIVASALSVGRTATVTQFGLVVLGRLALHALADGAGLGGAGVLLGLAAELVPVALVALLTTQMADDIHAARRRIQQLSEQDGLTGLYNMRAFMDLLAAEHERAARDAGRYALLMVDMDGLKKINDNLGHEAGNRAIAAVARAIERSTRGVDLISRYGGDEFLVLLVGADPAIAETVASRIRHNVFATVLDVEHRPLRLSVSVGLAAFPEDGRDPRELVNLADQAMYREKAWRRGRQAGDGERLRES